MVTANNAYCTPAVKTLDLESSKALFYLGPSNEVMFSTALCKDEAKSSQDPTCRTFSSDKRETMKEAVAFYNSAQDTKAEAQDKKGEAQASKAQAGSVMWMGPYGLPVRNPAFSEKMAEFTMIMKECSELMREYSNKMRQMKEELEKITGSQILGLHLVRRNLIQ